MDSVEAKVEQLYKTHFGKIVASMLYTFKSMELAHAEDIVQDAFSSAMLDWKKNTIPDNPAGWLYTVSKNKAINELKKKGKHAALSEVAEITEIETRFSESIINDQQLILLFACAHPDLSPKIQVAITLKYVINLKVDAIAKTLAMSVDGIDKMLVRARKKIEEDKLLLEVPSNAALKSRLATVHKVIYLVFNEGYKTSDGKEIIHEELCEEALLLARALIGSELCTPETHALYALMLFHASRLKARFTTAGDLLDLETQDRSLWNEDLITLGKYHLQQSETNLISNFHLEASIAYTHCIAASFDQTDWFSISKFYERLLKGNSNPFIELNYAIALYFNGKKEDAFRILSQLEKHPYMAKYYLLNATLGRLYIREDKTVKARHYLELAIQQTLSEAEIKFIRNILSGLD